MTIRTLAFGLLLLCPVPTWAQAPASVEYLSTTALRDSVSSAAAAANRTTVYRGGDRGAYTYVVVRRDRSGEAEVHAHLDDVIAVQEGSAILHHGGTLSGGRETAPGELRGGEIAGGTTQRLTAGDFVILPAGVPHRVEVEAGGSVTYLVVKVMQTRPAGGP